MSKEVENITGSSTLETNFATKISSQELESCDSYIPMTPLKPMSPKLWSICEQQDNWISEEGFLFPNNFAQKSQPYSVPARYNPSNSLNIANSFHNWEENLASGSCPIEFFESQLTNAAAPKDFKNSFRLGSANGECISFLPVYKSQFDSNRDEASSATSSPAKQGAPYGLNLWSNSDRVPDMNLHGNSTGTRFMYDLNYPPTSSTNAFFTENIPSELAPITPDHTKKSVCRNVMDGKLNQVRDNKGGEISTTRVETMELLDKELQNKSKDLQENHNSDKTDLNKTPQQKPRRRKHRPKVVIEGKPKRTPKPSTPMPDELKESPMCEKKYVRKNKSCKRAINFDLEAEVREEREFFISKSQAQNFSKVQLGEGFEIVVEKTQMGVAYDLNRSINKVLEEYISASKIQSINPQTPNKTEQRDSMANGPDDNAKGKCEINFSSETLDKQGSNTIMMENIEDQSPRGTKRGNILENLPVFPQSWDNTNGIPGMHFPNIYKKKRTEKLYCSGISRTVHAANACVAPHPTQYLECGLGADQKGKMMKKKRSKVPTRVRDFASLMGIIECGQKKGTINHSSKSIEALVAETHAPMKKKKRTKRLSFTTCTSTGILMKRPSTVDEITELLRHLDINSEKNQGRKQQRKELIPFNFQFEDKNALVIYKGDGTVVPFMGVFEPVKKRKPRPKVDLDEETDRVWKLLLENINSEGIDGTDDEKAKWWDEERKVFQGRADSFIARMHLVQGDRRFSPWKGSVLDSVVGVFLTQNVSDHLSSSAFMSLAAKFPLSSESSSSTFDEGASIVTKEPEVCIFDLEDTLNMQTEKEVMNTSESLGRSCSNENQINNTKSNFLGIFGKGLQIDNSTILAREAMGEKELDDAFSSQISAGSSKISGDSSVSQPEPLSNSNYNIGPSFVELLQMAASSQGHFGNRMNLSFFEKENGLSVMEGIECENCTSEQSGVTAESVSQKMVQRNSNLPKNLLIKQPKDNIQSEREINNVINIITSTEYKEVESSFKAIDISSDSSKPKGKTGKQKQKQKTVNWDSLRVQAQAGGGKRDKNANTMDSLDWEAVRCADVNKVADTIKERGMNNMLAERIKDFLNRLVKEHGSTDLEWLRDVPPDKAKEYLLSVRGLGLKSVECVRLLTLHHLAFPVDTNVGRIAVRLGWVPLQPLPESLQLHLLELYPVLESIQRYLWPRLCKLDQRTLYELHYQMITFGKVFCTKSKPNCNACPMRGECRHFASAFASSRLALPGLEEKSIVSANENKKTAYQNPEAKCQQLQLPSPLYNQQIQAQYKPQCLPIIEVPSTPEPIIEVPASPEIEEPQQIPDIEDLVCEDPDEIPTIKLNIQEFAQNLQNYMYRNMELQESDMSKALVALTPEAASIPTPKLKNVNRLRTEHSVYELPDSHPLLEGLDKREPDDPCSYLLAIWTPGETASSITPPEGKCSAQEFGGLCDGTTCYSCNSIREANSQTVRGTILIPCRTAMRGSFPLNGTYFQVNEVFADHDSSLKPIDVPRGWIWNLPRRTVYFGTSIPSIFKGLSTECIQYCFWRGFVCVRGFDQKTRGPRPLMARLHFPASKLPRTQAKPTEKQI